MSSIDVNARKIVTEAMRKLSEANGRRVLVAIAGAPGSGKSTVAERVVDIINAGERGQAALFPMDGFHYDDAVLDTMGRRPFKGAIDTFDAHGLRHMLDRLKTNADDDVAIPVFDRAIEIARAGARLIPQSVKVVVCEGNYLLARQEPWNRLLPIFDLTVFVDVSEAELRMRLQARWRGFGLDQAEIDLKVEENDIPNGRAITSMSAEPDLRLENTR